MGRLSVPERLPDFNRQDAKSLERWIAAIYPLMSTMRIWWVSARRAPALLLTIWRRRSREGNAEKKCEIATRTVNPKTFRVPRGG